MLSSSVHCKLNCSDGAAGSYWSGEKRCKMKRKARFR